MNTPLNQSLSSDDSAKSASASYRIACETARVIDLDDDSNLNPSVREACYRHLAEYVVLDEHGLQAAGYLLKLAWLWAHGFVYVEAHDGWAIVEPAIRMDYDFDPVLQEDSAPWVLYHFYRLDVLVPLLVP